MQRSICSIVSILALLAAAPAFGQDYTSIVDQSTYEKVRRGD